ncbi:Replication protein A 70 kDa DNA-binding subunit A [Bienertia sinuspersici]
MAAEYNFIHEITPLRENMTIKVRIIRLWKPPNYNNPSEDAGSIDMVFLDEKGGKILASVKKPLIRRFSNLLHEGQLRVITDWKRVASLPNQKLNL